jgi:hypothetical protein
MPGPQFGCHVWRAICGMRSARPTVWAPCVACFRRSLAVKGNPGPTRRKHGEPVSHPTEVYRPWQFNMLWRCWFRVPCRHAGSAKTCHPPRACHPAPPEKFTLSRLISLVPVYFPPYRSLPFSLSDLGSRSCSRFQAWRTCSRTLAHSSRVWWKSSLISMLKCGAISMAA